MLCQVISDALLLIFLPAISGGVYSGALASTIERRATRETNARKAKIASNWSLLRSASVVAEAMEENIIIKTATV